MLLTPLVKKIILEKIKGAKNGSQSHPRPPIFNQMQAISTDQPALPNDRPAVSIRLRRTFGGKLRPEKHLPLNTESSIYKADTMDGLQSEPRKNVVAGSHMIIPRNGKYHVVRKSDRRTIKAHETMREAEAHYNKLNEELDRHMNMSDYIKDFIKSKDPKFANKTKKERIRMAIGAYYAAMRSAKTKSK